MKFRHMKDVAFVVPIATTVQLYKEAKQVLQSKRSEDCELFFVLRNTWIPIFSAHAVPTSGLVLTEWSISLAPPNLYPWERREMVIGNCLSVEATYVAV
jgi:hypothetical protein